MNRDRIAALVALVAAVLAGTGLPSKLGMSPQLAITRSGSAPWSLLAQSQMPMPLAQWRVAASASRYCRCFCLSETITFT